MQLARGLSLRRRALHRAQRRDACFTNAPDLLEASPAHRVRAADPITEEPSVQILLVGTDLIDGDRLLVEKAIDGLSACGPSRHVDPAAVVAKVAVRLGNVL